MYRGQFFESYSFHYCEFHIYFKQKYVCLYVIFVLLQLNSKDTITLYADHDYRKLHPDIEEIVSALAFKAVEKACEVRIIVF